MKIDYMYIQNACVYGILYAMNILPIPNLSSCRCEKAYPRMVALLQ